MTYDEVIQGIKRTSETTHEQKLLHPKQREIVIVIPKVWETCSERFLQRVNKGMLRPILVKHYKCEDVMQEDTAAQEDGTFQPGVPSISTQAEDATNTYYKVKFSSDEHYKATGYRTLCVERKRP